ncbi:conjugal transfer protein TraA [Mesorhizobium sp. B2-7-3]|uniref:relaxase/mobilization nuclease domain-containing protein n=1 Tax=Mesorhizobium sp. B2-7-3 TaxID=2589907 RepID=UPI00112D4833|nr:conjugal transfer protein TraA [Mesorhizobium sp. B2-7-3]
MEFFLGAFEREWERRRAALLHEMQRGRDAHECDWRRRGGVALAPDETVKRGDRARAGHNASARSCRTGAVAPNRSMRQRFTAVAQGSQPAVVKLTSYGRGARMGAMVSYVSRNGELAVETDKGEQIIGKAGLLQLRTEWEHLFDNRASSRDVGLFQVTVNLKASDREHDQIVRHVLRAAFGERRFVYAIEQADGERLRVQGVLLLRGPDGERLTGDAKAAAIAQERLNRSKIGSDVQARVLFHGHGNGVAFATSRIRQMVERFEGRVRDDTDSHIETVKQAGDLVQKDWRKQMQSRTGRDIMHLVASARAGTDQAAFRDAVREFLGDQFPGHRYVYAMHDPSDDPKVAGQGGKRPHVHAHAIVTMRAETGERIETSPREFREWRSLMAEKAREHGIRMELTDRREFASAPAYARTQVRPVSYVGRSEHEGTSQPAQARYAAKRSNLRHAARSIRSTKYVTEVGQAWSAIARDSQDKKVAEFAADQLERIRAASRFTQIATENEFSRQTPDGDDPKAVLARELFGGEEAAMLAMTRPEFEAYEKRIGTILADIERSIEPWERKQFNEVVEAAREVMTVRRENLRISEQQLAASEADHNTPVRSGELSQLFESGSRAPQTTSNSKHEPISGNAPVVRSREVAQEDRLRSAHQALDPRDLRAGERTGLPRKIAGQQRGLPEPSSPRQDPHQQSAQRTPGLEQEIEERHPRDRNERER